MGKCYCIEICLNNLDLKTNASSIRRRQTTQLKTSQEIKRQFTEERTFMALPQPPKIRCSNPRITCKI